MGTEKGSSIKDPFVLLIEQSRLFLEECLFLSI